MTDIFAPRRQAVMLVPEPARATLDAIRAQWDPVLAAAIAAHVTLLYDPPADDFVAAIARESVVPVRIGGVRCWNDDPEHGIFAEVVDGGALRVLRERLRVAETPGMVFEPHVTLLHPATTDAATRRDAWTELRELRFDAEVELAAATVVDIDADGVHEVCTIPLARPAATGASSP